MTYNFNLIVSRRALVSYINRVSQRPSIMTLVWGRASLIAQSANAYFLATDKLAWTLGVHVPIPGGLAGSAATARNATLPTTNAMAESPVPFIIAETSLATDFRAFLVTGQGVGLDIVPDQRGAVLEEGREKFPGGFLYSCRYTS